MMAFNLFSVVGDFLRHLRMSRRMPELIRGFVQAHFIEIGLLLGSMLYFRNPLGRSDWIHVAYVLPAPVLLFLYIIFRRGLYPLMVHAGTLRKSVNIGVVALCFVLSGSLVGRILRR